MSFAVARYCLPKFFGSLASVREDRQRLARMVKERRDELGVRQDQMRDRGGPSTTKMTEVERVIGPTPTPQTLRKLDAGLGWAQGSAARVLAGGEPELLTRPTDLRAATDQELLDEIKARMGARHGITKQPEVKGSATSTVESEKTDAGDPRDPDDYDLAGRDTGDISEGEAIRRQQERTAEQGGA